MKSRDRSSLSILGKVLASILRELIPCCSHSKFLRPSPCHENANGGNKESLDYRTAVSMAWGGCYTVRSHVSVTLFVTVTKYWRKQVKQGKFVLAHGVTGLLTVGWLHENIMVAAEVVGE